MVSKVVQVTNIAPQATKDQMSTLFGYLGKIEDIRLYPTIRDVAVPVQSRICYVKYFDPTCVGVAQHMTNTVFIDRALIVIPVSNGEIPDEAKALEVMAQGTMVPSLFSQEPKLPSHVVNQLDGAPPDQVIITHDPHLEAAGLPKYPPLPATFDGRRIEEIRRTVLVSNIDSEVSSEQLMGFFTQAGEVKYVKFCSREGDDSRYALIEFSEQPTVINALKMNGRDFNGKAVQVYHSTQAISKPQAKSNEAAQREIEEAMTRVKEAQNFISAAIDPVIGMLAKDKKRRSRSGSRSRRSRSRSRRRRRSRSRRRSHSRRSRSRSPRRRGRGGRSRSPSRSRSRRSRSRSSRRTRSPRRISRRRSRSRSKKRSISRSRRSRSKSKSRTSSSSLKSKKTSRPDDHKDSKDRREHSVSKDKRPRDKESKEPKREEDKKDDIIPDKGSDGKDTPVDGDSHKSEDEASKDKDKKSKEKRPRHRSTSRSRSRSKSKGHISSKRRSRSFSPSGKLPRKRSRSRSPRSSSRRQRSPSRSPSFKNRRRSRSGSARHKSRSHSRF